MKAILIFEKQINEETVTAFINVISLNLEDNWQLLFSDVFVLKHIISKLPVEHIELISNLFIENVINNKEHNMINVSENNLLLNGIVYNILIRINKTVKYKKGASRISRILKVVSRECFINTDDSSSNLDEIAKLFNVLIIEDGDNNISGQCKEQQLSENLALIKLLPLIHMPKYVRTVVFIFMCNLLCDLKTNNSKATVNNEVEAILIGNKILVMICPLINIELFRHCSKWMFGVYK